MKNENSFFEGVFKKIDIKMLEKAKKIVKDSVWVTPVFYIIGTIAVLIRNRLTGLQFVPISLLQFSLITIYLLIFLFIYSLSEYLIFYLLNYLRNCMSNCKKNINIKNTFRIIGILIMLLISIISILCLLTENVHLGEMLLIYFIIWPISVYFINNPDLQASYIITVLVFITLILHIPMNIGGLKGQEVIYNDYKTNKKCEYIYYGNYDNLYQFVTKDKNKVLLIPIDSGYIEYLK